MNASLSSKGFDRAKPIRCEADFVLQGGSWLLRGIEIFGPDSKTPLQF